MFYNDWGEIKPELLYCIIGFLIIAIFLIWWYIKKSKTPKVSPEKISTIVDDYQALVLFYADWCGHSKAILPEWENVKNNLSSDTLTIEKVDSESDKMLLEKIGITGFPEIRFYKNRGDLTGSYIKYEGDRTYKSIKEFVDMHKE